MARRLRVQFPGAIYHVTFRGNERRAIFRDERDRTRILACLEEMTALYGVPMYLVCLRDYRVRLPLETPRGNLPAFMHPLLTAVRRMVQPPFMMLVPHIPLLPMLGPLHMKTRPADFDLAVAD